MLDEGGFTRSGLKFPDGILLAHGGKYENRYFCHSYGRDEEFVYYFTEITQTRKAVRLKACHDPKTFEVLHMGYMTALARDDKHVYCYDHTVKKADPKTARHIGEHYWCDKRYVFFNERIVEGADVSSFKIVLPGKSWSTAVAADKNHYYQYCDILSDEEYQEAARKSSM